MCIVQISCIIYFMKHNTNTFIYAFSLCLSLFLALGCGSNSGNDSEKAKSQLPINSEGISSDNTDTSATNIDTTKAPISVAAAFKPINDIHKNEMKVQYFSVKADVPNVVKGIKGTVIHIEPGDLIGEKGTKIGKNLKVELVELTNQKALLSSGVQTMSDGRLLESGGAYYINITSDGEKVKLKPGKTLSVEFPKISNQQMELFYGQTDALGNMNWKPVGTRLATVNKSKESDTVIVSKYRDVKEEAWGKDYEVKAEDLKRFIDNEISEEILDSIKINKNKYKHQQFQQLAYQAIAVENLGWINVDRFVDADFTNLAYMFDPADSISIATIYAVFEEQNSVVMHYHSAGSTSQRISLPKGAKVKIVAVSNKNDKFYSFEKRIVVKSDDKLLVKLKESPVNNIKMLFSK